MKIFFSHLHLAVVFVLVAACCMSSCIDIDDSYGASLQTGSVRVDSTEHVDPKHYLARIVVDFQEPVLAAQEFDEAGIVLYDTQDGSERRIPLVHWLSKLHNVEYVLQDLSYDHRYKIHQYFITHQKDLPESPIRYDGPICHELFVPHYAHLAFQTIEVKPVGNNSLDVFLAFNDQYGFSFGPYNYSNHFDIIVCPSVSGKMPDEGSMLRTTYEPNNMEKRGNVYGYHGVIPNLGINREYFVFATFYLRDLGYTIYSDTVKVWLDEDGHTADCAVDLGLSVLWSSHNFGTESPLAVGTPWGGFPSQDNYYIQNNLDRIEWQWSNGWRMPTKEEFDELFGKCKMTFEVVDHTPVIRFTASNGNSIVIHPTLYGYTSADGPKYGYYFYYDSASKSVVKDDRYPINEYSFVALRGVRAKN